MFDGSFLIRYGETPAEVAVRLKRALDRFEETLAQTGERFFTPIGPGEGGRQGLWSPAQQAEHVLKANLSFSKVIHLLGSARDLPPLPREPGEVWEGRPQAPANLKPGEGRPWAELEEEWRRVNERLLAEVAKVDPARARTFWHPFFGELVALDWARCAGLHTDHHRRQLGVAS